VNQPITQQGAVFAYFNEKLGLHPSDDFRGVCHLSPHLPPDMPRAMDDVAVAVGYNGFIGRACCMHVVINRPEYFSRKILREAFEYPFLVAGCEAVIGLVDSVNQAAVDFDKRIGFVEVARIAHAGLEGDLVILRMLRSECRWLRAN